MTTITRATLAALAVVVFLVTAVLGADDSKVKEATRQVESGAKKIGDGKIGTGVEETAKGIGNTIAEGAKFTGEKLKESGQAAEPQAKTAWQHFKSSADAFGTSVKNFFSRLFSD